MIPLGNWQERIDELESENFDLAEAVNTLEDEIAALLAERDEMNDVISMTVEARVKAEAELEKKRSAYEWVSNIAELRGEGVDRCHAQIRELEARAEDAEAENAEYARVGMAIANDLAIAAGDRDGWKIRAEKAESEIEQWKTAYRIQIDRWEKAGNQWKDRAEKAEARIKELESQNGLLLAQAEQHHARAEKAEADLERLDAEWADRFWGPEDRRGLVQALRERAEKAENELFELRAALLTLSGARFEIDPQGMARLVNQVNKRNNRR